MKKDIVEQLIIALNKANETPSYKEIVTRLFNNLKADKEENYKDFKEHVDNKCDCNCAIKAYYEVFDNLSDDELKEIIKENNITKDIYENFDKILCDKYVSNNYNLNSIMRDTNKRLQCIFYAVDEDKPLEDKPLEDKSLEDMSKEELINMIKKMNQ